MTDLLHGKTAIVTGGANGIGRAVAHELASEGAHIVVADVDESGAQNVAGALPSAEAAVCDVRDDSALADLVERTGERHGGLDIMVANAGIATVKPVAEMTVEEWRSVLAVNLDGVYSSVRYAGRFMAAGGGGPIITMASITGFAGAPLIAHYAAAKAGVLSLTKTVAVELRDAGVRVNAVCPGWIGTDLVLDRRAQFERMLGIDFTSTIDRAQGRLGTAEDVAPLVAFLASERSRFCTGSEFVVDGGMAAALV